MLRTDETSTEIIASTAFVAGTYVVNDSGFTDMRDYSEIVVYFEATDLGTNTEVEIVSLWSDDGTTIPFSSEGPFLQTDFDVANNGDGSFNPYPYVAKLTTTGGELVVNQGVHLSFPKGGSACRIGVRGDASDGTFSVRVQRITHHTPMRIRNRTDAASTEVIAAGSFYSVSPTWTWSSEINTKGFETLVVFYENELLVSATDVELAVAWSDDGTTVAFGDDYQQNSDVNITDLTDGTYDPQTYVASYQVAAGNLAANTIYVLRYPVKGGSARIGVRANGTNGPYNVRILRVVE